jgi:ABC-type glutathione transport system ATPase component
MDGSAGSVQETVSDEGEKVGKAGMDVMPETRDLAETYGNGQGAVEAAKGIDLQIKKGEIFSLLGPNGAGKPATIRSHLVQSGIGAVVGPHPVADRWGAALMGHTNLSAQ